MAHPLVEERCQDLNAQREEILARRVEIQADNARINAGYAEEVATHRQQLERAMAEGRPMPPTPDPPTLAQDTTVFAEQALLERRRARLRECADEIEAAAEQREREILDHARRLIGELQPEVEELQQLLDSLREVRLAVDSAVPGVYPRGGRSHRTAESVAMLDVITAAMAHAVILAPVPSVTQPVSRVLLDRPPRPVPEPAPAPTGKVVYTTRRAG